MLRSHYRIFGGRLKGASSSLGISEREPCCASLPVAFLVLHHVVHSDDRGGEAGPVPFAHPGLIAGQKRWVSQDATWT